MLINSSNPKKIVRKSNNNPQHSILSMMTEVTTEHLASILQKPFLDKNSDTR